MIVAVASDLEYLRSTWRSDADANTLRRSSNILRMLVVDKLYGNAWRAAGFKREPLIEAVDLSPLVTAIRPESVLFAIAGGGSYNGMTFGTAFSFTDETALQTYTDLMEPHKHAPPVVAISLTQFSESLCMIVYGERVSRRHIIHYVANKRGGTHFDPTRHRPGDDVFRVLDYITDTPTNAPIQLGSPPKPLVFHELLAIGRCLALASDTLLFLERVRNTIS